MKKVANDETSLCNISEENSKFLKDLANSIDLIQIFNLQARYNFNSFDNRSINRIFFGTTVAYFKIIFS